MSKAFEYALREHLRANGEVWGTYGNTSLIGHIMRSVCTGWVIPSGAKALPDYSYEFDGTDADRRRVHVIKLDTPVSCECGERQDQRIQVDGTMGELMTELLKIDVPNEVVF